jgi:hypothetical protein
MVSNLPMWVCGRAVVLILAAGCIVFAVGCHHEHHDEGYGYGGGYGDNAGYGERGDYHDRGYGDRGGYDRGYDHHD